MEKILKEIHEIMEKIYEEEKNLTIPERVKKIREEAEKLINTEKLKIKRIIKKI